MNKTAKIVLGVVVLVVIVIWVNSSPKDESDTIKIGYFGPLTGPVSATVGEDVANAYKLANAEKFDVRGKKVEIIYEDDACDPKQAVSAAEKLINIDKVKILISGICSGSTLSVAPIAEKNKVILFTAVSTSPKLTEAGDYIFRTSASSIKLAEKMSEFLISKNYKNVATLYEEAEYTSSFKDAFTKLFEAGGGVIVDSESSAPKALDMRTQALKIKSKNPDMVVVFMNSSITANASIKQLREIGIKTPIIGNEFFNNKSIIENPINEGIYAINYDVDTNSKIYTDLIENYKNRFNTLPSDPIYVALAYDGYGVLYDAIKSCGSDDVECVKKELYKTSNYKGISGGISIDKNGDTERQFKIVQIKDKKLIDVK